MSVASAKQRLYIHETIEISVKQRQQYLEHFQSWAEASLRLYGMKLVGVWAVNGSTHRWAEGIVLWEHDGADALAAMLGGEYAHMNDPEAANEDHYKLFWDYAPPGVVDTKGKDRLLAPTSYSPGLEDLMTMNLGGVGYLHQTVVSPPGKIGDYLERLGSDYRPLAEKYGMKFVGSYRSMLVNDSEAVVLWSIPDWKNWAAYELAQHDDKKIKGWRKDNATAGIDWEGKLLHPVANNPLESGKLVGAK